MIKKTILLALLAFIMLEPVVIAQNKKDDRTQSTKIADLLATLPSINTQEFNKNMLDIAQLGEDGYVSLIKELNTSNATHLATITYAINGYSSFVSAKGQEANRNMAVKAYNKALNIINSVPNKVFVISQYELVGNDEAVPVLNTYLTNDALVDATARALAKINSPLAQKTLLSALSTAKGVAKLSIITALGHSGLKNASAEIIKQLNANNDVNLTKVSLYALANLADASAEPTLAKAAATAGYKYENTNAVSNYLLFANKVKTDDAQLALKIAKDLQNNVKGDELVGIRIGALALLASLEPSAPNLLNALDNSSFEYRAAALKFALPQYNEQNGIVWVKKLAKADPATQVSLLQFFADAKSQLALPEIAKLTKSKEQEVRNAAIAASAEIAQEQILESFLKDMNKANTTDLPAYKNAILRMKGQNVSSILANALTKSKPEVQVLILNSLAAKAASEVDVVFNALKSKDQQVSNAAYGALKSMVNTEHLPKLFTLLTETSDSTASIAVQDAIIAALKNSTNKNQQIDEILVRLQSDKSSQKPLYYNILASLGGDKSLAAINEEFKNGDAQAKKSALTALGNWTDQSAGQALIEIARKSTVNEEIEQAINGYLKIIKATKLTAEQRLLWLRNAMDVAKSATQKLQILKDAEQSKIINTIIFAGKYLNDPTLQQAAAQTVMNVTLAGKYNGALIKDLLNQTISIITGPDSEYQKEAMRKYIVDMNPGDGFVAMYNGKDLSGWQGLVANPIKRSQMDGKTLAAEQEKANAAAQESWKSINNELHFMIKGDNLATVKKYGDFEMLVDWKIIDDKKGEGDAGIYLRGTPQVQIWDNARVNVGAQVGSGGLYNNQKNPSKPLKVADNKLDEWNTFRIIMIGDRVTVYLNGELVTDNVILENYWDRNLPIFIEEQIELQAHGSPVAYRDLYIKELPKIKPFTLSDQEAKEGYKVLFDGTNMHSWIGNTTDYIIENGNMAIRPKPGKGSGGNLFTKAEYSDFNFRFEFKLTPGANNGLGIRAPLEGDAAYEGMELQILDNEAPIYKNLKEYQYHGSVYGTIAAKRGFLKPTGEWNYQEVIVKGSKIKVILNGETILDADISEDRKNGAADGQKHPGLLRETGHIGFLGHGSPVEFRNIRIKDLSTNKK